jgi:hypothetical protein
VASKTGVDNTPAQTIIANNRGIKMLPDVQALEESDDKLLSLLDELINNL